LQLTCWLARLASCQAAGSAHPARFVNPRTWPPRFTFPPCERLRSRDRSCARQSGKQHGRGGDSCISNTGNTNSSYRMPVQQHCLHWTVATLHSQQAASSGKEAWQAQRQGKQQQQQHLTTKKLSLSSKALRPLQASNLYGRSRTADNRRGMGTNNALLNNPRHGDVRAPFCCDPKLVFAPAPPRGCHIAPRASFRVITRRAHCELPRYFSPFGFQAFAVAPPTKHTSVSSSCSLVCCVVRRLNCDHFASCIEVC